MNWVCWFWVAVGSWALYEFIRFLIAKTLKERKWVINEIRSLNRFREWNNDDHRKLLEEIQRCRLQINKLKKNGKKEPTKGKAR